jgi:hypothetical protein
VVVQILLVGVAPKDIALYKTDRCKLCQKKKGLTYPLGGGSFPLPGYVLWNLPKLIVGVYMCGHGENWQGDSERLPEFQIEGLVSPESNSSKVSAL